MKESILRKLILLLLLGVIVSVLWAVGANARKHVELEKNKNLDAKLEKLTRANTVIINDLKSTSNRLADLQQKERMLKKELEIVLEKNEALQKPADIPPEELEALTSDEESLQTEAETLKATNTALGEEILKLKAKDLALRQELEKIKAKFGETKNNETDKKPIRRAKKEPRKRVKIQSEDEDTNSPSSSKNFSW